MKLLKFLSVTFLSIMLTVTTSCGGDKDEDYLVVNPTSISLLKSEGSSATFTITSPANWTITGQPDWLNLSSVAGSGGSNISIIVTAKSDNNSSSERSCDLYINSGSSQQVLTVTQNNGLQKNCDIKVTETVLLSDSYAMKLEFGSKVSYYYGGYISGSSAGWTDDKIVSVMEQNFAERDVEEDAIYDVYDSDFYSGQSIIQCFCGFDKDGNRGEVLRIPLTIPKSTNQARTTISNVYYDDTYFHYTTTVGAYTDRYADIAMTGLYAFYWMLQSPAYTAMAIRDFYNSNGLPLSRQTQSWIIERGSDTDLFVATWSQCDNVWSNVLVEGYYSIDSDSSPGNNAMKKANSVTKPRFETVHSMTEYKKNLSGFRVMQR